ncbi:MAG: cell division protein FtsL [Alphaproteobacteria bacterium]
MIRAVGAIWLILIAALVTGLFHFKQEVQILERRLAAVDRTAASDRRAIEVLQAEWTYLNRPERLARLARRYLRLRRVAPNNVRTFSALPLRFGSGGSIEQPAGAKASQ